MSAIMFSPTIGPVTVTVMISERHESTLTMTDVPIEGSANATDHAYSMPDKVSVEVASEGAAATYQALRAWQKARVPFTIVTGLEIYSNMLIEGIRPERDAAFSKIFRGSIDLRQVIIVETSYIPAGASPGLAGGLGAGLPGGANSLRSAALSASRALGSITGIRASRTTMRGVSTSSVAPTVEGIVSGVVNSPAQNRAILAQVFG